MDNEELFKDDPKPMRKRNKEQEKEYNKKWILIPKNRMRSIYYGIRYRCNNPKCKEYRFYGGRGIKCLWSSFEDFYRDMGNKPDGMSIDRKDTNGNYCKDNCRWATQIEQCNNTRKNKFVEYKGERLTYSQICRKYNKNIDLFKQRMYRDGWSVERAMTS